MRLSPTRAYNAAGGEIADGEKVWRQYDLFGRQRSFAVSGHDPREYLHNLHWSQITYGKSIKKSLSEVI